MRRRLVIALTLQTLVLVLLAGLVVATIVAEQLALREYGDTPPPGGYGTIFGSFALVVLAIPAVLTLTGWLRARRDGATPGSVVPTALGSLALALVLSPFGALVGWGTAGIAVPVLPMLALAWLALSSLRGPRTSPTGGVDPTGR